MLYMQGLAAIHVYHIPCKHFFAVFEHRPQWQWEQLPESYLHSAYLLTDRDALDKHFDSPAYKDNQQHRDGTSCVLEEDKITNNLYYF